MKYSPHKYQTYATDFILEHPVSAVFLDMGLGKSVITLTAIFDLCLDSFLVRKVLVIAPLRVAADTWPCEIEKWDHLRGLTYSVAVGSEAQRKAALLQRVSVYIINRENVQWLVEDSGLPFDYDMVVIDELSSFKSYQAKRFRALLKVRPRVKRGAHRGWSLHSEHRSRCADAGAGTGGPQGPAGRAHHRNGRQDRREYPAHHRGRCKRHHLYAAIDV